MVEGFDPVARIETADVLNPRECALVVKVYELLGPNVQISSEGIDRLAQAVRTYMERHSDTASNNDRIDAIEVLNILIGSNPNHDSN